MTTVNKLVQVAGVIDAAEADMIIEQGADWLGFALRLPSRDRVACLRTLRPGMPFAIRHDRLPGTLG